jgi:death-on-curing protein
MIDLSVAEFIHKISIEELGGLSGVRDSGLLDSALNRPFVTFDSIALYPTPIEKSAALLESVVINHPFFDGNKRTAYLLMKYLLFKNGIVLQANEEEKYEMVVKASTGEMGFEEIKQWLLSHTKSK